VRRTERRGKIKFELYAEAARAFSGGCGDVTRRHRPRPSAFNALRIRTTRSGAQVGTCYSRKAIRSRLQGHLNARNWRATGCFFVLSIMRGVRLIFPPDPAPIAGLRTCPPMTQPPRQPPPPGPPVRPHGRGGYSTVPQYSALGSSCCLIPRLPPGRRAALRAKVNADVRVRIYYINPAPTLPAPGRPSAAHPTHVPAQRPEAVRSRPGSDGCPTCRAPAGTGSAGVGARGSRPPAADPAHTYPRLRAPRLARAAAAAATAAARGIGGRGEGCPTRGCAAISPAGAGPRARATAPGLHRRELVGTDCRDRRRRF
jgi:hypothetical protein